MTAQYLSERFGTVSFYLIGEKGLRCELEAAGHHTSAEPEVVVVGLDRQLTYEKLDGGLQFLRTGARLIGSYGGAVYMGDRWTCPVGRVHNQDAGVRKRKESSDDRETIPPNVHARPQTS